MSGTSSGALRRDRSKAPRVLDEARQVLGDLRVSRTLVDKICHLNPEGDSCRTLCVRVWLMRPGISIILSPADRRRLEALVGDRNVAQKHVWRARIVLHSADGIGTNPHSPSDRSI